MIYFAVPYSHPDPRIVQKRFEYVTRAAGHLMRHGHVIFSPITHSHPIAQLEDMPGNWEFWAEQDLHILELCEELWVMALPGWKESTGVQAELARAKELDIPRRLIYPQDMDPPLNDLRSCGL